MNKEICMRAISHINPSDDFIERTIIYLNKTISETKKENHKVQRVLGGSAIAVACITILFFAIHNLFRTSSIPNSVSPMKTELNNSAILNTEMPSVFQSEEPSAVYYSDLKFPSTKDIQLPQIGETETDIQIGSFSDEIKKYSSLIIKGTVTNIRFNKYDYVEIDKSVPDDSFKHSVEHHAQTIVYEIQVDRIYYKQKDLNIGEGQQIIIENNLYNKTSLEDSVIRLNIGNQYIIPMSTRDNLEISISDDNFIYEGTHSFESLYYLTFGFTPQIHLTEDGKYVFYAGKNVGWHELLNENAIPLIMNNDNNIYQNNMYLRDDENFESEFQSIVNRITE